MATALRRAPELARFEACLASPLATALTSPQLAKLVHVGERTLRRRVKSATGHTPIELVILTRLERVAEQLRGTAMSVKSIADHERFADSAAVDHCFKRYLETSPSAFRQDSLSAKDYAQDPGA